MPKGDSVRAALKAKVGAGGVDFQVCDTSREVKDLRGDLNKKKKTHTHTQIKHHRGEQLEWRRCLEKGFN